MSPNYVDVEDYLLEPQLVSLKWERWPGEEGRRHLVDDYEEMLVVYPTAALVRLE